ncbi:MAG: hypothetical protein IPK68_05865 [Bdellovibrionales bacterium]|nr:hypothetical protein [Bdellovibrionales bacterium]
MKGSFQTNSLRNEDGMALIVLLALMPALFLLFVGYSIIGHQSLRQSRALHTCRVEGLKSQFTVAKTLDLLLKLNPLAHRLRISRMATRAALAVAILGPPHVLIAAQRADNLVAAKQEALQFRQQSLLASMQTQLKIGYFDLRAKLRLLGVQSIEGIQPKIAIAALPAGSPTPNYHPLPNFTELSKIQFRWRIPTKEDPWLEKKSTLSQNFLNSACAVGIKERFKMWKPSLIAVK